MLFPSDGARASVGGCSMPCSQKPNDAAVITCICGLMSTRTSALSDCTAAAALPLLDARCTMAKASGSVNGVLFANSRDDAPEEHMCFRKPPDFRVVSPVTMVNVVHRHFP